LGLGGRRIMKKKMMNPTSGSNERITRRLRSGWGTAAGSAGVWRHGRLWWWLRWHGWLQRSAPDAWSAESLGAVWCFSAIRLCAVDAGNERSAIAGRDERRGAWHSAARRGWVGVVAELQLRDTAVLQRGAVGGAPEQSCE